LRVRRIGRKRVMTFKWPLTGAEGAFTRGEMEAATTNAEPQPDLLGPDAAKMIADVVADAPLEPRSQTIFRRRIAIIEHADARIEVALDEGRILANGRTARIAELELELKGGDPVALFDLASGLVGHGLRVSAAPKGLRGHWLATGEAPREVRAVAPDLSADSTLDESIAAILESNLKHFVANWPALSPDCPEGVHQMRVALRRLRAALGLFNKGAPHEDFVRFRAEAKRIAGAMGEARDQDVIRNLIEKGPARVLGDNASLGSLLKASARKRAAAYVAVRELIDAPETSRFVLDLQSFIARRGWKNELVEEAAASAPAFAAQSLGRLDKRALKRGKGLVKLAPEERHEARIALKNLRYAADFFSSLFSRGKGAKKFARAIGELQEALGAYNDAIVARAIVADLEKAAGAASARAAGAVEGWTARGAVDADADLATAWKKFRKAPRFWK
jgi:inorganic triphosphatase YgiF